LSWRRSPFSAPHFALRVYCVALGQKAKRPTGAEHFHFSPTADIVGRAQQVGKRPTTDITTAKSAKKTALLVFGFLDPAL
jgi:hypothetical protein